MPHEHALYIPLVAFAGFLAGTLVAMPKKQEGRNQSAQRDRRAAILSVLTALAVFVATHIMPVPAGMKAVSIAAGHNPLFDQRPSFNTTEIATRLEGFGTDGRNMYQVMTFTSDVIFPLSLLAFLLALARLMRKHSLPNPWPAALVIVPLLWFATDMLENLAIFIAISSYPEDGILSGALGYLTVAKFSFLVLSIIVASGAAFIGAASPSARHWPIGR